MNIVERPSYTMPAPKRIGDHQWSDGHIGSDFDVGPYQVAVRRDWLGAERSAARTKATRFAMLQICRADGGSVFDWRDLQQIKNLICGPEWEAVEIFPAESRLKDPSNARYLWCCNQILPFGLPGGRKVVDAINAIAPQRPFPAGGAQ